MTTIKAGIEYWQGVFWETGSYSVQEVSEPLVQNHGLKDTISLHVKHSFSIWFLMAAQIYRAVALMS